MDYRDLGRPVKSERKQQAGCWQREFPDAAKENPTGTAYIYETPTFTVVVVVIDV